MDMAKLFALEDGALDAGDVAAIEPGSVDASVVQAEMANDVDGEVGITSDSNTIDASIEQGAEPVADIEEAIEESVANGEEISPVAAECIRITMKNIRRRLGADPTGSDYLFATENFSSRSSAKANTQYALEGVGSFLMDIWKKIKAALIKLWEKIKDFYNKHLSGLGRVAKAIEAMKTKINESSGKIKDKAYIDEAPSSIADAFAGAENVDITPALIIQYMSAHGDVFGLMGELSDEMEDCSNKIASWAWETNQYIDGAIRDIASGIRREINGGVEFNKLPDTDAIKSYVNKNPEIDEKIKKIIESTSKSLHDKITSSKKGIINNKTIHLGTKDKPLITGKFTEVKFTLDKENKLEIETDVDTIDKDSKRSMTIPDKAVLKDIISKLQILIKTHIKFQHDGKLSKEMSENNKILQKVSMAIEGIKELPGTSNSEIRKMFRSGVTILYKLNSKVPTMFAQILVEDVKLARAVLGYTSFILRQYKTQF